MPKPKILVTGATGKTGGQVAAQLLAAGYPVRAFVRQDDARSEKLRAAGAEIAIGDLTDPQALLDAMHGVKRAYFLPPFDPYMIQSAAAFTIAARDARLESVVVLSQWLSNPEHPSLATRQHWLADNLFALLPSTALTIVNPGFFADMPYMSLLKYAAHLGVFPVPARGSSRNAPPSVDDIARVAVAALTDPDRHAGKRYRPTGPEMLSLTDMAAIMGKVLGRTVRHVKMPLWMFYKAARMDGFDHFLLSQMGAFLHDHDHGAFELGGPTQDVLETTGRQPESFETVTRRYAAHPSVQRSAGNLMRTFGGFMSVPLRPGFDPDRFARMLQMPRQVRPILSADSAFWRREHGIAATSAIATERTVPTRGAALSRTPGPAESLSLK
jgi:uncharacterized protein YbjT (DUF2867 family)